MMRRIVVDFIFRVKSFYLSNFNQEKIINLQIFIKIMRLNGTAVDNRFDSDESV